MPFTPSSFLGQNHWVPRLTGIRKDFCELHTLLRTSAKANRVSTNLRAIAKKSFDVFREPPKHLQSPHGFCEPQITINEALRRAIHLLLLIAYPVRFALMRTPVELSTRSVS